MSRRERTKTNRVRLSTSASILHAELFSGEQLRQYAAILAHGHRLDRNPGPNPLLPRLADNEQILDDTYDLLAAAAAERHRGSPAGEWLLDNFYLIEEQFRLARTHLPRTYSRELPRLTSGATAGFPRVYDIALELIAHTDGRVDAENVSHFVAVYQSVTSLTLGELWAVPIMLRLGLIENLRRVAESIAERRHDLNLAELWAGRLLAEVDGGAATILHVLAEMAETQPPFSCAFVEEFCGRLQGQSPALATVESWIHHRLAEQGLTRERLQWTDTQTLAADQISIGNSIGSLRFLNAMDWRTFVETMSQVEQMLDTDPAAVYAGMDFTTRDRYRHCVETLARLTGKTEDAVARTAIGLATDAAQRDGSQARSAHVGFYLVDKGRLCLERALGVPWSPLRSGARMVRRFSVFFYAWAILTITAGTVGLALAATGRVDWQQPAAWTGRTGGSGG